MLSRRDVLVALFSTSLTFAALSLAGTSTVALGPLAIDWREIPVNKTDVGEYRQVIKAPTATLDELELHVTTLMPGLSSHAPHQHVNEELVILREGTVEVLSGGQWKRLSPGSVVFNASNSPRALRNVGTIPAVYHVINWSSAETKRLEQAGKGQ
ncbi:MAG: cupin domain-containing protein [Rubrivivax sp.]|nr:MAG: cupin domain-containing protein [Rubrivivax sp.]